MAEPNRGRARELAEQFRAAGDHTGWFDALYKEGRQVVPWADRGPSPNLVKFFERNTTETAGKKALTVGCGYGDDAEYLAGLGFETTAFDISPTAIDACRQRFPEGRVRYTAANLLTPPVEWKEAFDFVLESNTVQALPRSLRADAIRGVAGFVKKGGRVLVLARAREEHEEEGQMPWPLTRKDLDLFLTHGLQVESFEDFFDEETPPVRRFRAVFVR